MCKYKSGDESDICVDEDVCIFVVYFLGLAHLGIVEYIIAISP